MPSKITGNPICVFNGPKIYAHPTQPKKKGKQRIWLSVRQDDPKEWRIAATLSYVNSIDVRFEK